MFNENYSSSDKLISVIDMTGKEHTFIIPPDENFNLLEKIIKNNFDLIDNNNCRYNIDFFLPSFENKINKDDIPESGHEIKYHFLVNVINNIPRIFKTGEFVNLNIQNTIDIPNQYNLYSYLPSEEYMDSVNYIAKNDKKFMLPVIDSKYSKWLTFNHNIETKSLEIEGVEKLSFNSSIYEGIKLRYLRVEQFYLISNKNNKDIFTEYNFKYQKYKTSDGRFLLFFWRGAVFETEHDFISIYDANQVSPFKVMYLNDLNLQPKDGPFKYWCYFDVIDDNNLVFYRNKNNNEEVRILNIQTKEILFSKDFKLGKLYYDEIENKFYYGDYTNISNKEIKSFFRLDEHTLIYVNHVERKVFSLQI